MTPVDPMAGRLALHGGGEFLPGDERFLGAILRAASDAVVRAGDASRALRIVVVPTAAARGRPDLAARNGVAALERVARDLGLDATADAVAITDTATADDLTLAASLETADLIHWPGGDPDLIPRLYPGTAAWRAIQAALGRGAVLAGASAGAMAMGERTWTPGGLLEGLALVPGILVVPHADAGVWGRIVAQYGTLDIGELGVLGLAERTGLIGRSGSPWTVAGEGEVRWLRPGERDADAAIVATDGATIELA